MRKAILEFDEKRDLEFALEGRDWYLSMWDLDQWLRSEIKYGDKYEELQPVRDKLYEILQDYELSMDKG